MRRHCTTIEVDTTVEVDIEWSDLDTNEMIEELQRRAVIPNMNEFPNHILNRICLKRKSGEDYTRDLDDLIYNVLGRI